MSDEAAIRIGDRVATAGNPGGRVVALDDETVTYEMDNPRGHRRTEQRANIARIVRRETPPTEETLYLTAEAVEIVDALQRKGYAAHVGQSGVCETIDGKHVHRASVVVALTAKQAARFLR